MNNDDRPDKRRISVRMDEKLYYGTTLLARKKGSELDKVVRWALNRAILFGLSDIDENGKKYNLFQVTWSPQTLERLDKLSKLKPEMLTKHEVKLLAALKENPEEEPHNQ